GGWLPEESAATPVPGGSVEILLWAPRNLRAPPRWKLSAFTKTRPPMSSSRVRDVNTGVRLATPARRASAASTSSNPMGRWDSPNEVASAIVPEKLLGRPIPRPGPPGERADLAPEFVSLLGRERYQCADAFGEPLDRPPSRFESEQPGTLEVRLQRMGHLGQIGRASCRERGY